MKTFTHGEVLLMKACELPKGLKKVNLFKEGCYRLADSETSGNFHLLEAKEGVDLFEDSNGVLWLKNDVPCNVYCAIKERHDNITLEPGIWEIDRAQEYDYLTGMNKKVSD
jgi:hypothetical protein